MKKFRLSVAAFAAATLALCAAEAASATTYVHKLGLINAPRYVPFAGIAQHRFLTDQISLLSGVKRILAGGINPSAIPEPATLAMLIVGAGLIGFGARLVAFIFMHRLQGGGNSTTPPGAQVLSNAELRVDFVGGGGARVVSVKRAGITAVGERLRAEPPRSSAS